MLKVLLISLRLKITYWVNSRLNALKSIPGIKRLVTDRVFGAGWIKTIFNVLGVIREVLSAFIYKYFYVILLVFAPILAIKEISPDDIISGGTLGTDAIWQTAMHILFFLTLVGTLSNNDLFDGSMDKYYAVELLKLDPRKYTLSNYGYFLFRSFIGFLAVGFTLCAVFNKPIIWAFVIPFFVICAKIFMARMELVIHEMRQRNLVDEVKINYAQTYIVAAVVGGILGACYTLVGMDLVLPENITLILMLVVIGLGIISGISLLAYKKYREFCRHRLVEFMYTQGMAQNAMNIRVKENIESTDTTSNKTGFEYLNDLFIKRHRKILWRSTKRMTIIIAAIIGAAVIAMILPPTRDMARDVLNTIITSRLTVLPFVLYFINRGRDFTQALFMNCDHSLLTYPFFKEPKHILHLFRLRLIEIFKVNLVPAAVLGAGLAALLLISGGTDKPLYYPVLILTTIGISAFFSVHYLVLYYLLQPYNRETEVKSGLYSIIMFATYFPCYMLMQAEIPAIPFAVGAIVFSILYSLVALILAYKLAPKTFKIRT